jgi:predicted 2-oxoglutarate/Fe(II)-dependent dioxygenase YbiX
MINYTTISNFLSKKECEDLLQFSLTKELKPALVSDTNMLNLKSRKSNIFFYDYSLDFPNLNEKLINIFKKEVNVKGYNIDFTNNHFQFTQYTKDGYYNWHTDSSVGIFEERYCSMVIQLNDEYTGGELQIKNEDDNEITLEEGMGNLFIFYSNLIHRVKPVISGTRYSLVNWFRLTPIENFKKTLI